MKTSCAHAPAVTVRGLTKAYGGRAVVDEVDLDVERGETVGLIGANGAGKTTTVECVQGLRRPDRGHIRVFGFDPVREPHRVRSLVGSQLQSAGLPDRLRVAEAVALFAAPVAAEGKALLEQFGLERRARSPFAGLSGGERQRLFLVLALLNRPRLVILDELTQGLDPAARRDIWSAVRQLREQGVTVLLVTHELDELEALCQRVMVMRDGRILDQGAPASLVARHAGPATARFTPSSTGGALTNDVQELARRPGVRSVGRIGRQLVVRGSPEAMAHVGAWLVSREEPVPHDFQVDTPGLESALLNLLDAAGPGREERTA